MRAFEALLFVLGCLTLLAYGMTGGDGQMVPDTSDTGGAMALRGSLLRTAAQIAVAAATTDFIGAATSSPPRCSHFKTQDKYCDKCASIYFLASFLASQQQQQSFSK